MNECKGPFGGNNNFKERIALKFNFQRKVFLPSPVECPRTRSAYLPFQGLTPIGYFPMKGHASQLENINFSHTHCIFRRHFFRVHGVYGAPFKMQASFRRHLAGDLFSAVLPYTTSPLPCNCL